MNNSEDIIETINHNGYEFEVCYDGIISINTAENLCSYINIIKEFNSKIKNQQDTQIFYRGQAKNWRLMPKLFSSEGNQGLQRNFNKLEKKYYYEALTRFPEEFSGLTSLDKLAKMQHYGWPTRLLDVTTNPLAALWFACSDKKHEDEDGFVYLFKTNTVLPYDSDRALMLSCLPRFDSEERKYLLGIAERKLINELVKKYPEKKNQFNLIQTIRSDCDTEITRNYANRNFDKATKKIWEKYIYEIIRERSAFFDYHINPKDILSAFFVRPQLQNNRIKNQDGAFIIFGLNEDSRVLSTQDKDFDKDIKVDYNIETVNIKIPKGKIKENILKELDLLNINKSTLFQDMDNTADYIKSKFDVI